MAYSIVKNILASVENGKEVREITAILDAVSDLDSLGTHYCPGSVAMVADSGAPVYMLNASGVWKEI